MGLCKTILYCLTVVFMVAAVICHIVALATQYWLQSSDIKQVNFLNLGLWEACFHRYTHDHEDGPPKTYHGCHGLYSDYYKTIRDWLIPSWLVSVRVLAVISLILQLVGAILVIFLLLWLICRWLACNGRDDKCERFMLYAAPITWILTGMFLMMTVMIFADNAFRLQCKDFWLGGGDPNNNELAYSWGFEVAACVFSFVTGGCLIGIDVLKGREKI